MSQHEYEDLVSYTIEVLDQVDKEALDLRSMIWNLYNFQNLFDTGFTHFRVLDILIKHRYVYRLEIPHHPDYPEHSGAYDKLIEYYEKNSSNVKTRGEVFGEPVTYQGKLVNGGFNKQVDLSNGYYSAGWLYVDAGRTLWSRLVESKRLPPAEATAPSQMPLQSLVLEIMTAAQLQGCADLIKLWYPGLTAGLFQHYYIEDEEILDIELPEDVSSLRTDDEIQVIRNIVQQTGVLEDEEIEWYASLGMPSPDSLQSFLEAEQLPAGEANFLRWWFME